MAWVELENLSNQDLVAKRLNCLNILEKYKALVYNKVAEAFEQPLAKSLFLSISQDSTKHATLLKGVANSISDSKAKIDDCAENVGRLYALVGNCVNELTNGNKKKLDFSRLVHLLASLENGFGEEYSTFLQGRSLRFIAKGLSESCEVNVESVKNIFESILADQEHHGKRLKTLEGMVQESRVEQELVLRKETQAKKSSTPEVKYQNPDAWTCALPPATYESY